MEKGGTRRLRIVGGAALLAILALCGYAGAKTQAPRTVSVAVTRQDYPMESWTEDSAMTARERLQREREEELAMLTGVEESEAADAQTKANALAQIAQIVQRMETEAQTEACLEEMGFKNCVVFSGAQTLHILTPYENIEAEAEKNRMLDAACSLTGYDAADIKIILTKK